MCGFIGCLRAKSNKGNAWIENKWNDMNQVITHRGPDEEGVYVDEYINFGFRRLSIIDIDKGHQPLTYENGRYWIVFNGEIYNHIELRRELINKGYSFYTNSDTEVITALYSYDKEHSVRKLRGMFSFIIWDKKEQRLFGARDYFGIKPFYYVQQDDITYFASEKKSLLFVNQGELRSDSLQHYLSFQYVPEPETIIKQVKKLPPGYYFTQRPGRPLSMQRYWQPSFQPVKLPKAQLQKEVREALMDSVHMHMRSDVPVGAFLSGGIDSSIIVALAKQIHPHVKTFSVGFEKDGFSEIDIAEKTAEVMGLENVSYVISPEEFVAELPNIMWHMDDPLADPAAIPLYFVAREAKKHVKVALSGEGADELFGDYNIYREPHSLKMFKYIPRSVKLLLKIFSNVLPEGVKGKSFIERGITPLEERYIGNAKIFEELEKKRLLNNYKPHLPYTKITEKIYKNSEGYDAITKMQHLDIHTWLRGDILLKADKMTMAHSLELRVPFLDKRVFDVASKIPANMKVKNKTTKYILRKAVEGIVPEHVLNRQKLGFPVPIRYWLKNELYDWALQLIHSSQTSEIFNKQMVFQLLDAHVMNKKDNSRKLWAILTFMIWHQVYVEKVYTLHNKINHHDQQNIPNA